MKKLNINFMKKYFRTAASALVVFAILISAFTTSVSTVVANTDLEVDSNFSFDTDLDFGDTTDLFEDNSASFTNSENSVVEAHTVVETECSIKASKQTVKAGEGLTLEWKTKGFTNVTINGEVVTGNNGSIVITNVQSDATYTLIATNSDGAKCKSEVKITCIKDVPKYCELTVTKAVDKHNALPETILPTPLP